MIPKHNIVAELFAVLTWTLAVMGMFALFTTIAYQYGQILL